MSTAERQIFVFRRAGRRSGTTLAASAVAGAFGLGIGVLTSYGQGWLTGTPNAFVNSESAWLAIGSAVAVAGLRRPRDWGWLPVAVVAGLIAQVAVTHVYR